MKPGTSLQTLLGTARRRSSAALVAAGLAAASLCGCLRQGERERDAPWPAGVRAPGEPARPINVGKTSTQTDLNGAFPESSQLVGVAVAPNGERYVLDAKSGLYRLGGDGTTELVLDTNNVERRFGLDPDLEFTDVAAYGDHRFLVTAENDGFLLDLWAGSFESYFCYLPPRNVEDSEPEVVSVSQVLASSGIPVKQRTESVAVHPGSGDIFAQPQTIRLDLAEDSIAASELFVFSGSGGQPLRVVELLDTGFSAGGMVTADNRLILGFGAELFELAGNTAEVVGRLEAGVVVSGMARDIDGSLVVLDGPGRRLLDVSVGF